MLKQLYCSVIAEDPDGKSNSFRMEDSPDVESIPINASLAELVESDRKWGMLRPKDGKKFYYKLLNHSADFHQKIELIKSINLGWLPWDIEMKYDFDRRPKSNNVDITYEFVTASEDPLGVMKDYPATLAYMGYPNGSLKGICRINDDYDYTLNGKSLIGAEYARRFRKQVQFQDRYYKTYRLPRILRHENGHCLGLGHDTKEDHTMSASYRYMSFFLTSRDISRVKLKGYAKEGWNPTKLKRWRDIIKVKMERL